MANFTCLAAARDWCAERPGFSVAEDGLAGQPQIPVLPSGYVHASAMKSLALLGLGRANVRKLDRATRAGGSTWTRSRAELAALDGGPAIVIANAGEVNAGDFDPIEEMADLAERHGAWLHVDGAFGLFARVSPRTAHLAAGAERAQLGLRRRAQVAERAARLRLRLRARAGPLAARLLRRGRRLPAARRTTRAKRSPTRGRRARAGRGRSRSGRRCARTAARATGQMVERHLDLAAAPGRAHRRGARVRAAGRGAAQHRLLPLAPGRACRRRSSTT